MLTVEICWYVFAFDKTLQQLAKQGKRWFAGLWQLRLRSLNMDIGSSLYEIFVWVCGARVGICSVHFDTATAATNRCFDICQERDIGALRIWRLHRHSRHWHFFDWRAKGRTSCHPQSPRAKKRDSGIFWDFRSEFPSLHLATYKSMARRLCRRCTGFLHVACAARVEKCLPTFLSLESNSDKQNNAKHPHLLLNSQKPWIKWDRLHLHIVRWCQLHGRLFLVVRLTTIKSHPPTPLTTLIVGISQGWALRGSQDKTLVKDVKVIWVISCHDSEKHTEVIQRSYRGHTEVIQVWRSCKNAAGITGGLTSSSIWAMGWNFRLALRSRSVSRCCLGKGGRPRHAQSENAILVVLLASLMQSCQQRTWKLERSSCELMCTLCNCPWLSTCWHLQEYSRPAALRVITNATGEAGTTWQRNDSN